MTGPPVSARPLIGQPSSTSVRQYDITFALIGGWTLYYAMLLAMFFIYVTINAEGLRVQAAFFGQRLADFPLPFFHYLDRFQGWRDLDCALLASLLMYVFSIYACHQIVAVLSQDEGFQELPPFRQKEVVACYAIVAIDCWMFYWGAMSRSIGTFSSGSNLSFSMVLFTGAYLLMLLGIAHWGVSLIRHKKENSK